MLTTAFTGVPRVIDNTPTSASALFSPARALPANGLDFEKVLKKFFAKLAAFVSSGAANKALNTAAELVPKAIPFLDVAAAIATGLTPTTLDDALLAQLAIEHDLEFLTADHDFVMMARHIPLRILTQ